ncbi:MAG: penicillin-binding protein 2 [Neisseria sp.]|nr:penicillin-binding protein 2 [Neisseria sp.]
MLIRNDYKPRMTPTQTKKHRPVAVDHRIYIVLLALASLFVALVVRSAYFQFSQRPVWDEHAKNVFVRSVIEPGMRGKIVDRHGALLATNEPIGDVIIDPYHLPDFDAEREKNRNKPKGLQRTLEKEQKFWQDVKEVAHIVGLPPEKALSLFDSKTYDGKKRGDVYLLRKADKALLERLKTYSVPGLKITQGSLRRYPDGQLFGHVLGVTKIDVAAEDKTERIIGLEGMEYAYDKSLQGRDGLRMMIKDDRNNYIESVDSPNNREPVNGKDLVLSLDKNVQIVAMTALQQAVAFHRADGASAVVLDARTGEILAMANYPAFDPARFAQYAAETRRNQATADAIEPGSVLKPLVVAKALDQGKVTPATVLNTAPYELGGRTIRDVHDYPSLSITGVIQKSSNVGSSKLARQIPAAELHAYLAALGFSAKPNSGFPGETEGVLRPWKAWRPIDHAVIGYGYGLQISLLQLARSYTVFTNDGTLLPVTLLKRDTAPDGVAVLRPQTAQQMRQMMRSVTESGGTGTRGAIEGYDVAAKSGTTEKLVNGRYSKDSHRALFVGFAPVDNPRVIVAVGVDNPQVNGYYGGLVAAPVFAEIMGGTLNQLGVPAVRRTPPISLARSKP